MTSSRYTTAVLIDMPHCRAVVSFTDKSSVRTTGGVSPEVVNAQGFPGCRCRLVAALKSRPYQLLSVMGSFGYVFSAETMRDRLFAGVLRRIWTDF